MYGILEQVLWVKLSRAFATALCRQAVRANVDTDTCTSKNHAMRIHPIKCHVAGITHALASTPCHMQPP